MNDSVLHTLSICWEHLPLHERRKFISYECAQLAVDLCDAGDAKGLEVLHNHLITLSDFIDTMQVKLERNMRRIRIYETAKAIYEETSGDKEVTQDIVDRAIVLIEEAKQYLDEIPDEEDAEANKTAYNNIMVLINKEKEDWEETLSTSGVPQQ